MKKIITILLSMILVLLSSACLSNNKQNTKAQYYKDMIFVNQYAKDLDGVIDCEYEMAVFGSNDRLSVPGPSDYAYSGVIYLEEEEAEDIFNSYSWTQDSTFNQTSIGTISLSSFSGDTWYRCDDFAKEKFPTLNVKYLRFNGKNAIIFDCMTY